MTDSPPSDLLRSHRRGILPQIYEIYFVIQPFPHFFCNFFCTPHFASKIHFYHQVGHIALSISTAMPFTTKIRMLSAIDDMTKHLLNVIP